jgi:hypothetical protein
MQDSDRLYRAVISLNNMGVSMLEQGRHDQAQATLADAMALLRPAFRPLVLEDVAPPDRGGPKSCHRGGSRSDVNMVMARANQRYASLTKAAACGAAGNATELVQIAVLSSRADAADIAAAIGSSRPSLYPVLHPVRLELNDQESLIGGSATSEGSAPGQHEEFALVACLAVLQNCAIATLLVTGLGPSASEAAVIRPFRMLQACHRVLSGLGRQVAGHLQLRLQTFQEFVVHRTLVEMLLLTGRGPDDEVAVAMAHAEQLRHGLDQLVRFDRFASISSSPNSVAPAA